MRTPGVWRSLGEVETREGHPIAMNIGGDRQTNAHFIIARCFGPDARENTAFIIEACKAHESLMKAANHLASAFAEFDDIESMDAADFKDAAFKTWEAVKAARAAIGLIEEGD